MTRVIIVIPTKPIIHNTTKILKYKKMYRRSIDTSINDGRNIILILIINDFGVKC